MVALDPLFARVGYDRIERPVALAESAIKGLIFDCRMCGQCVLSSTGMSCPMNCPKELRNGPCGGVRPGGFCEVRPEMRCVWVLAWQGAALPEGYEARHEGRCARCGRALTVPESIDSGFGPECARKVAAAA